MDIDHMFDNTEGEGGDQSTGEGEATGWEDKSGDGYGMDEEVDWV